MFRQIAVIFILLAVSVQVFNRGLIVIDYQINQAAFAKNCENITRPTLHCNGKCQMIKKLKENEKQEQKFPGKKWSTIDEVVSSKSFFNTIVYTEIFIPYSFSVYYFVGFTKGVHNSIFHPPGLV